MNVNGTNGTVTGVSKDSWLPIKTEISEVYVIDASSGSNTDCVQFIL